MAAAGEDVPLSRAEGGGDAGTGASNSRPRPWVMALVVYAVVSTAFAARSILLPQRAESTAAFDKAGRVSMVVQPALAGAFWNRPAQYTGCSNWAELRIDDATLNTSTPGECGELCLGRADCSHFGFQPTKCFGPEQSFRGACMLFRAGCDRERNVCWDLYEMKRGGEERCLDGDTMLQDDPDSNPLSKFTLGANLGPLSGLIGKWSNAPGWKMGKPAPTVQGLNVVSLPDFSESGVPGNAAQTAAFTQLTHAYVEEIEFTPIMGAIRNRGYSNANHFDPACQLDQFFLGLHYVQKVTEITTGMVIHDEVGQWLFNEDPGIDVDWKVARLALIPHGQAVEAIGLNSSLSGAQAIKDDISATMTDQGRGVQFSIEPLNSNLPPGSPYARPRPPFNNVDSLLERVDAAGAPNMTAIKLDVTTSPSRGPPGGSIGQLPNPKAQTFTEQFNHTYWIESWTDADGKQQMQIQYVQTMFLTFMASLNNEPCQRAYPGLDCLIKWPHFEMNTLKKVADYPWHMTIPDFDPSTHLPPIR